MAMSRGWNPARSIACWLAAVASVAPSGCWHALRWSNLHSAGFTIIDLVGTLPPQGCGLPCDGASAGHGSLVATDIASQNW
jgi:hypothetical protein